MVTSDFRPKWKYGHFVHAQCIRQTACSLLTRLLGRYHVPQNAFLVWSYNTRTQSTDGHFVMYKNYGSDGQTV